MTRWIGLGVAAVLVAVAVAVAIAVTTAEDDVESAADGALVGLPATDPCGAPVLRPSGVPWRCAFASEFDGGRLDPDQWGVLTTEGTGGRKAECRIDDAANIAVRDGVLLLTARRLPRPVLCASSVGAYRTRLTAGAVTTSRRFAQTYGRVEIRASMPGHRGPGFHSALWMYPQTPTYGAWPASGEIDIAEYRTGLFARAVPTVHWERSGEHASVTDWNCVVRNPAAFHSYVLEWSGAGMRFLYDGRTCLVIRFDRGARPFDQPFFVILNQSHGGGRNLGDASTPSSATMQVDSVKVWR